MKLSNSYFFTIRENIKDEDSVSGNLLVRGGFVRKNSAGVYMFLPLGLKVLNNIQNIVRDEMNKAGAQEVLMPALIPEETYVASGRRAGFGSSMFSLKDRNGKPFVLGPTHEELFAIAGAQGIHSYKDLPFNLYQLQTKFRDEPRPRFGLLRVREFIMHDAYSFDKDLEGLDVSYKKMYDAYVHCMNRFELDYVIVTADTGVMGGLLSQEFQALSETGEDTIVTCDSCDLSTNLEVAQCPDHYEDDLSEYLPMRKVSTPNAKTIEEVAAFFGKKPTDFVKTLIYKVDDKVVACLVRGNRDVNETKLRKLFGANEVALADAQTVEEVTHAKVGFAGPVGLDIPVIADYEVTHMRNFIVGANENDLHYENVNLHDFKIDTAMDLRLIQENDRCPVCGGKIVFRKGIEVANPFKLGDKYSKAMNLYYSDVNNEKKPVIMGSYGLGIGRAMAAIVEQKHDDFGILWPISVAPYKVAIVPLDTKNEEMMKAANDLYDRLNAAGIDTLMDDREERPGVKFKDMDLIGIPMRVTFGKAFKDHQVEFKLRTEKNAELIDADKAEEKITSILADYFKNHQE